jgi:hypothetical protein
MFIGAGVAFAVAITEQIVGHVLIKRSCIDPAGRGDFDDVEDTGEVVAACAEGVVPAVVLRVQSDLALLATIGLAAGGAALRGKRHAFDDAFGTPAKRPSHRGLQGGGIGLVAAGAVTWLTTSAVAWGLLTRCETSRCANRARVTAFSTRSLSAVMVASGAGMLAYAESLRRNGVRYRRERAMSIGPALGATHMGFTLTGRF